MMSRCDFVPWNQVCGKNPSAAMQWLISPHSWDAAAAPCVLELEGIA